MLILNFPLGLYSGWFGLGRFPDETLKMEKVQVIGYPKDKDADPFYQWASQKGKLDHIKNEILEYSGNIDCTDG